MKRVSLGYKPNPKQVRFFTSKTRHVCYGGAKMSGKSWAARVLCVMLACRYPGLNILLLRRTLKELRDNHTTKLIQLLYGIARYNSTESVFTFPNQSRIILGYCDHEGDVGRYQGSEYDVIFFEEATRFTEQMYQDLILCNRNTRQDFKPQAYYTCNPGGVGHAWVKRLFVEKNFKDEEKSEDYEFIKATIYDNYVAMARQPEYVAMLKNLPEDRRRALLDGDWDVFVGQYFPEFRRERHVMEPFPIPNHWPRYRAIDYGLDMLACLWMTVDEQGDAYVYRELCEPDLVTSAAAAKIQASEAHGENIVCTYAPRDLWARSKDTGIPVEEQFARAGVPLLKTKNGRVAGWINMKEWLKPVERAGEGKIPRLRIFRTCETLINCIPALQHAKKDPNDVESQEQHNITHAPDALRYMLDGRPMLANPVVDPDPDYLGYDDQVDNFLDYGR